MPPAPVRLQVHDFTDDQYRRFETAAPLAAAFSSGIVLGKEIERGTRIKRLSLYFPTFVKGGVSRTSESGCDWSEPLPILQQTELPAATEPDR
jgi:hypothetical protein